LKSSGSAQLAAAAADSGGGNVQLPEEQLPTAGRFATEKSSVQSAD
jgi:hypothetical protein